MKIVDGDNVKSVMNSFILTHTNDNTAMHTMAVAKGIIDLEEELDVIAIPKGASRGDIIRAMFPDIEVSKGSRIYPPARYDNDRPIDGTISSDGEIKCSIQADSDWWNSPYKIKNKDKEEPGETEEEFGDR